MMATMHETDPNYPRPTDAAPMTAEREVMIPFTAEQVRNVARTLDGVSRQMLNRYADALARAVEPVAWSLIFEPSRGVNAATTFSTQHDANAYADECARPDMCNPFPCRPTVVPLYTHPSEDARSKK